MQIKNSDQKYGLLSRTFHWLSAMIVVSLFASGLWMVGLDYYSEWYQTVPNIHRSVGVVLLAMTLLRLLWYRFSPKPPAIEGLKKHERIASVAVHHIMLLLVFGMVFSGYLITTAQGDPLYVFDLFTIPATLQGIDNLEDYAGTVHYFTAFTLIALACLHVLAALKHHFINKDGTLRRML